MRRPLLEVKDLKVEFKLRGQCHTKAVDGISFSVCNLVSVVPVGEIARQELGRIAGFSREMVGRVLKTLEEQHLISVAGKTIVVFSSR